MWQPSDWIAIAALSVAGLSLGYSWWDRRSARAESYRAALYERQLTLTQEQATLVRVVHDGLVTASDDPQGAWRDGQEQVVTFWATAVFLPPEVAEAARAWLDDAADALEADMRQTEAEIEALEQVAARMRGGLEPTGRPAPQADYRSLEQRMDAAWNRFVDRLRQEMGAGELHRQVRELIGAESLERGDRDLAARVQRLNAKFDELAGGKYSAPKEDRRP